MTSPAPTPTPYPFPFPYPMPPYQDYWGGGGYNRNSQCNSQYDNSLLNSLQHQSIDKNITDNASAIIREVNGVDKHLIDGVCKITDNVSASTAQVRDNINTSALGLRDAVERNALNITSNLTNSVQSSADRDRDIQVSIERTAQTGTNATERNASLLLQSVERNAGETRYTNAVSDAANRQATNDLARDIIGTVNKTSGDIINQTNRNSSELMTAVQLNGSAGSLATTTNGYEVRTLVNSNYANTQSLINTNSASIQSSICSLGNQSSQQYASLLLEQQKVKEHLGVQLAEAKYEALKNKEGLSAQLATSSCEAKYEALKNTQALSSQLAECCCEIKTRIDCVGSKMDDTLRTIDTQRLRDALNTANNEVNLLKFAECSRGRFADPFCGYGGGGNRLFNNYYSDRNSRHNSPNRPPQ